MTQFFKTPGRCKLHNSLVLYIVYFLCPDCLSYLMLICPLLQCLVLYRLTSSGLSFSIIYRSPTSIALARFGSHVTHLKGKMVGKILIVHFLLLMQISHTCHVTDYTVCFLIQIIAVLSHLWMCLNCMFSINSKYLTDYVDGHVSIESQMFDLNDKLSTILQ